MRSETILLPADTAADDVLAVIDRLNADRDTHGILVQTPLPPHIDPDQVMRRIDPLKDVDGFHPMNVGKLVLGDPTAFRPATPAGIQEILRRSGIETRGARAVIVGRSTIVGPTDGQPADAVGTRRRRHRHRLPFTHPRPAGDLPRGGHPGRRDRACQTSSGPTA